MMRVIIAKSGLTWRGQPGNQFVSEPEIDRKIYRRSVDDWQEKLNRVKELVDGYDCRVGGSSSLGCVLICGEQDGDETFKVSISFEGSIDDVENQVLELLEE